jgi:hypothetical protein
MKMLRYYFISKDLDDLERFEVELEREGIPTEQIHCLSLDDTSAENHLKLHDVAGLMKKDLFHAASYGLAVGVVSAIAVLAVAYGVGWTGTPAGWVPFIFLAIIALGFFTWEGGLWGIQTPNVRFKQFEEELRAGRHVFFVDVSTDEDSIIASTAKSYPKIQAAGIGTASPHWFVIWNLRLKRFFGETMP